MVAGSKEFLPLCPRVKVSVGGARLGDKQEVNKPHLDFMCARAKILILLKEVQILSSHTCEISDIEASENEFLYQYYRKRAMLILSYLHVFS